ncbi:MAG TPA: hypothetical protein DCQ37_19970, partial [Desulfobacteraceae bacterium]|nr:hypothetical protein [Desulfobacteraceae bacterium]
DSSGNIYVADSGNDRIQKFSGSGKYISQFGTSGSDDGQFSYPYAIAIDISGNIYVADNGNDRIQKFSVSDAPYISYSPACFTMDDAMAVTVSCAQYEGVQYGFMLNYTPVSTDSDGYYWKMDTSAVSQVQEYPCMLLGHDLKLNLCIEYQGAQYEVTLNYTPVASDSDGIYWKADPGTLKEKN